MIRQAVAADMNRAVELMRDAHSAAGFDRVGGVSGFTVPFDPAYIARLYHHHLNAPTANAFVYDVAGIVQGLLLAAAFEHPFGPVWVAKETVWWIEPKHRGRAAVAMLDAYEAWAAKQGCKFVGMGGMGDDPVVGKLYRRRGYVVAETLFLKSV